MRIFASLQNIARIGTKVPLANIKSLDEMPPIPQDQVFVKLVIQATTSSIQVPSTTKDLEVDFTKVVKALLAG